MFLKHKTSGDLVAVEALDDLYNPLKTTVIGRDQAGQEEQEPQTFDKHELEFVSGEPLPQCWIDARWRAKLAACLGETWPDAISV